MNILATKQIQAQESDSKNNQITASSFNQQEKFKKMLEEAEGWGGDEYDREEAIDAMLAVGQGYLVGKGVDRDEGEGVKWIENAAYLDCHKAMFILEDYYLEKNPKLAELWGDRIERLRQKATLSLININQQGKS